MVQPSTELMRCPRREPSKDPRREHEGERISEVRGEFRKEFGREAGNTPRTELGRGLWTTLGEVLRTAPSRGFCLRGFRGVHMRDPAQEGA